MSAMAFKAAQEQTSPEVGVGPRLCENAKAINRNRTSYTSKAFLRAYIASASNFEIELKIIILVRARTFEFSHSLGPSRHIAPPRILGRKRGIAEIDRPTPIAEGDARDPEIRNLC